MWKYLSGVSPPPPKKQAKYDKTKSEQNRERKFLAKWETRKDGSRREWLGFDEQEEVMFCRVCWAHATSHERSLVFVTGSKLLKCDSITKHEISDVHKRCQEIEDAKQRGGSAAGETEAYADKCTGPQSEHTLPHRSCSGQEQQTLHRFRVDVRVSVNFYSYLFLIV